MLVLYILGGIFALFLVVIFLRAASFRPKKQSIPAPEPIFFHHPAAIDALQKLVRCKTVSNIDPALEDDAEFEKLIALLPDLYPRVYDICSIRRLEGRGLLLRWPGRHDNAPTVLMAHYDVVSADGEKWGCKKTA